MTQSLFSIQFVSKVTGINGHTIRAWEKRYQAVTPQRDKNGRRQYTQDDIERLKKLHQLTGMGNNISELANLQDDDLDGLVGQFLGKTPNGLANGSHQPTKQDKAMLQADLKMSMQNLLLALNHYKLDIISHELNKIKLTVSPRDFALDVMVPLLSQLATRVSNHEYSLAQSQALEALLRFHVGHVLFTHFESQNKTDFTVTIATPEGDFNEFPIMIAALLCAHYHLNFVYLGTGLSAESFSEASAQVGAKACILAVSRAYYDNQSYLDNYIQLVKDKIDPQTKIFLGGHAKLRSPIPGGQVEIIPTVQLLDARLNKLIY